MTIDIEISEVELSNLERGGFYILNMDNGVRIVITKNDTDNSQD